MLGEGILDKYEYRLRAEQIVKLVGRKKYTNAMQIADEIDWNRVKNVQMLCTVSDVYEKNNKYEEAREILFLAYDRSPADRLIVYKIVELSLELGDLKGAVNYFREYCQLAPNDTNIYILKYKLYVANNANLETLISVLEEFKEEDFHEEWGYELARLYARGGYIEQCIALCDELDLWFNDGPYVLQALELKQKFSELTDVQKEKLAQNNITINEIDNEDNISSELEDEEDLEEISESSDEEDIFFAGNQTAYEKDELDLYNEDSIKENDEQVEYGEELEQSETASDNEEQDSNEVDEFPKTKNHSDGVLKKLGRFGKMLVEPALDYDMDDEETEEDKEDEKEEDLNNEETITEHKDKRKLLKKVKNEKQDKPDYSKLLDAGNFDLSHLGVKQDITGKKRENEDNDISQIDNMQSEPLFEDNHNEEDIDDADKYNDSLEYERSDYGLYENISEENVSLITEDVEEQEIVSGNTKPFDKLSFKGVVDKQQYEKNMESALRNLDKVVNTNNMKEEEDEILKGVKEHLTAENNERVTPVWNGVSRYDTMNLQKELAKSIQKLLEATEMDDVDSTLEDVKKLVEDSNIPELTETMRFRTMKGIMLNNWAKNQAERLGDIPEIENIIECNFKEGKSESVGEIKRKFPPKKAVVKGIPSIKLKPTKEDRKREMEKILVQENDGQIGLIMPEKEVIEKQITGQLNIQDILREWERQKSNEENEREKKALEEARTKALNETQEFMSQVMDLLNQCIPKYGGEDDRLWSLTTHLRKVQQALNSTNNLSEISKLNSELSETLDKICPIAEVGVVQESIGGNESIDVDIPKGVSQNADMKELTEENKTNENDSTKTSVNSTVENEKNEISQVMNDNIQGDNEEEPVIDAAQLEAAASSEEEEKREKPRRRRRRKVVKDDDVNNMLEEALYRIAMEVQDSASEDEEVLSAQIQKQHLLEDDDAADDIEDAIEDGLPVSAKAITESEDKIDLFEPENNLIQDSLSGDTNSEDNTDDQAEDKELINKNLGAVETSEDIEFEDNTLNDEETLDNKIDISEEDQSELLSNSDILPKKDVSALISNNYSDENGLTQKQKEAFSYFATFDEIAVQMNQLLNVDKKGNQNLIITGNDGCGKTSLAIRIIKAQELAGESGKERKVAKIKGTSLNSYDLDEVFTTVEGGVLIIEKAVALSDNTMTKINNKINNGSNVQIILTTKKKSVERLSARNPEFMDRFKVFIDVPPFNNNELVEYGRVYAKSKGYLIEDMAVLALFSRLGNLQSGKTVSFNEVKDVIDEAVSRADRRNNKFIKRLFGKKHDEASLYLMEEDFGHL